MLIGISDPLGAKADRLRCEVFQNLILIPINTGTLRHAVATALTVYGIETRYWNFSLLKMLLLQQPLPFTVLKRLLDKVVASNISCCNSPYRLRYWNPYSVEILSCSFLVATALTVYGIETARSLHCSSHLLVATALTVYGIETKIRNVIHCGYLPLGCNSPYRLRYWNITFSHKNSCLEGCNSPYRLRYWNAAIAARITNVLFAFGCNSAYCLRYWNANIHTVSPAPLKLQQCLPFTVLKQ